MFQVARRPLLVSIMIPLTLAAVGPPSRGVQPRVTREEVERAIKDGVNFLKREQGTNGSWPDADQRAHVGTTGLVTLALLTAGESPDSPHIARALAYLQQFEATDLGRTYSVALQTMVFAAADPARYKLRLAKNVDWLERAQIRPGDRVDWPGSWNYSDQKEQNGDNSNTQYALLGLHAASEVGIPVRPEIWALSRQYWESGQRNDGGWTYFPEDNREATASMTCAGISSLIITGMRRVQGQEDIVGDRVVNCGEMTLNPKLQNGIDWLSGHFRVGLNFGNGQQWKFYYLYGLERTGRLSGMRFFGANDWYLEGAEHLVHLQRPFGSWDGQGAEGNPLLGTSFALLFLAKGRAPVVMNKLRHGPAADWNNDPDDVRNLVGLVSRDWKHLLTWQTVDPRTATVEQLLQAPIVFFNGHEAPEFDDLSKRNLREYVEQGGFIFAEACCGRREFDRGFRQLMKEVFPEAEYELHPLAKDHAIWRSKHILTPDIHPLWGIEHGCRTVVVYSPGDLSCYWNQMENKPANLTVIKASRVGQNVVDYATGRELPDKLTVREVKHFAVETPKRGALQIAKLKHPGDWNVAPLAVPNLASVLRDKLGYDVVINHREIVARDPNIINYPLIYIHGRAALSFTDEEKAILRRHLDPGGGTFFADAACGSAAFDASFRSFVASLLPDNPLVPIPVDDEIYTKRLAYDLADVEYTKAAGGGRAHPQLEGVKLNGHWAIIYSKYDIGCALERQSGNDCKGYTHESAMRIAANIVVYSTLP